MEVLTHRALDDLPTSFKPATRRTTRRLAAPSRSLGYFSAPPTSRARSARSRATSAANSPSSPLSESSAPSASARSSVEFSALPARERPVLPDIAQPFPDSLSPRETDMRPTVSVLGQPCCAIEGDHFRAGESVARLPCGCVFHRDCIIPFIFRARNGGYCPLDGTPVPRVQAALLPVWQIPYPSAVSRCEHPPAETSATDDVPTAPLPNTQTPSTPEKWSPAYRQTCAIDSARFTPGEPCVRLRSCGHVFHARCAVPYLEREHHPCCPLDGRSVGPTDVQKVFVSTVHRGMSRDTRLTPRQTAEPRTRDPRVRKALRALVKSASTSADLAADEAETPTHVRSVVSAERAQSVRRRRRALGDPPLTTPDIPYDACAADGDQFEHDDDLIALECGHALHARCAHRGCGCEVSADQGAALAGSARELIPILADRDARRWRCAELAALAREKTRIRALDTAGDSRSALAVAERAASEISASFRVRRAAIERAISLDPSANVSQRFIQDPNRRRSLPDQPGYQYRTSGPPQLNLLHSRSTGRRGVAAESAAAALRRGTSFARLPRAFRAASPRSPTPTMHRASSTVSTTMHRNSSSLGPMHRNTSTLSEPAREAVGRSTPSTWSRRTARGIAGRDTDNLPPSPRSQSDVPPRSPFAFLTSDVTALRVPIPGRHARRRRRDHSEASSSTQEIEGDEDDSIMHSSAEQSVEPSSSAEHGVDVCVIDLEEFKQGDVLVRLPCMHSFHRECILPYLKQQERPSCPIDRTPVHKAHIDDLPVWEKK